MALIACTDKQKKHRVYASGNLERRDYYCPYGDCNAVLSLVDCDDDVKSDHFRVKPGYSHIENCLYSKNDLFLEDIHNEYCKIPLLAKSRKDIIIAPTLGSFFRS